MRSVAREPATRRRKYSHLRTFSLASLSESEARVLLRDYGRLVLALVGEYRRRFPRHSHAPLDEEDLVSIGNTLLLQAWQDYDPTRGMKFSSWAAMAIRQGLGSILLEARGVTRQQHSRRHERPIDYDSIPSIRCLLDAPLPTGSGGREITLLDTIADEGPAPDDEVVSQAQRDWLAAAIERCLTPREREVIACTMANCTQAEIGERYGVSRQAIEQVQRRAIEKLIRERTREERRLRRGALPDPPVASDTPSSCPNPSHQPTVSPAVPGRAAARARIRLVASVASVTLLSP
jgi:RNA polymerase sigma factor (sigma-70 family)